MFVELTYAKEKKKSQTVLFFIMGILYIKLHAMLCYSGQDLPSTKLSVKTSLQRPQLSYMLAN